MNITVTVSIPGLVVKTSGLHIAHFEDHKKALQSVIDLVVRESTSHGGRPLRPEPASQNDCSFDLFGKTFFGGSFGALGISLLCMHS